MRSGEPSRISLRKRWISLTLRARLKWLAGVIHIAQMLCVGWNWCYLGTFNEGSDWFPDTFLAMIDSVKPIKRRSINHLNGVSKAYKIVCQVFYLQNSLKMCKYFIEIVKAANFGQNPYKLSFAIQYRETSHSPSPPVESSYVQISPSQYTAFGQWWLLTRRRNAPAN